MRKAIIIILANMLCVCGCKAKEPRKLSQEERLKALIKPQIEAGILNERGELLVPDTVVARWEEQERGHEIPGGKKYIDGGLEVTISTEVRDIFYRDSIRFDVIISNHGENVIKIGERCFPSVPDYPSYVFIHHIDTVKLVDLTINESFLPSEGLSIREVIKGSQLNRFIIMYYDSSGKRKQRDGDKDSTKWINIMPERYIREKCVFTGSPGTYDITVGVPVPFDVDPRGYILSKPVRFTVKLTPREAAAWRFLKARLESKEPVVARKDFDKRFLGSAWENNLKERYAYQDVIKKYPNTKAAEYAREQLKH